MPSKKTTKETPLEAVHRQAKNLHASGLINKTTMREFDEVCEVEALTPTQIRGIREGLKLSQQVFAKHCNVTVGVVSKWERGALSPRGPALKLLTLVQHKGLEGIRI